MTAADHSDVNVRPQPTSPSSAPQTAGVVALLAGAATQHNGIAACGVTILALQSVSRSLCRLSDAGGLRAITRRGALQYFSKPNNIFYAGMSISTNLVMGSFLPLLTHAHEQTPPLGMTVIMGALAAWAAINVFTDIATGILGEQKALWNKMWDYLSTHAPQLVGYHNANLVLASQKLAVFFRDQYCPRVSGLIDNQSNKAIMNAFLIKLRHGVDKIQDPEHRAIVETIIDKLSGLS